MLCFFESNELSLLEADTLLATRSVSEEQCGSSILLADASGYIGGTCRRARGDYIFFLSRRVLHFFDSIGFHFHIRLNCSNLLVLNMLINFSDPITLFLKRISRQADAIALSMLIQI